MQRTDRLFSTHFYNTFSNFRWNATSVEIIQQFTRSPQCHPRSAETVCTLRRARPTVRQADTHTHITAVREDDATLLPPAHPSTKGAIFIQPTSRVFCLVEPHHQLWSHLRRSTVQRSHPRPVPRPRPVARNATSSSTLHRRRYGPSNHRQCQTDQISTVTHRSARQPVANHTTTTGSTDVSASSARPSIPPCQPDNPSMTDGNHRSDSTNRRATSRYSRRTHQRTASLNWLQTINWWIDKYFVSRVISFDFEFLLVFHI